MSKYNRSNNKNVHVDFVYSMFSISYQISYIRQVLVC